MRIGIDIDDTITDTSKIINEYSRKIGKSNMIGNIDFVNLKNESLDDYKSFLKKYIDEVLDNCPIKDGSIEVINKLKQSGNQIYLITARSNRYSKNIYDITVNYLKRNNIVYDELFFDYEDKYDICQRLNLDYMIDDNIEVYNSLLGTRVKPILFEKDCTKDLDLLKVNNWNDILNIIK